MKTIGVGIIGCGLMGRVHAACYAREKGCRLVGFQNRSPAKAAALADEYGGQVYRTPARLLADPAIDVVSICSSQQVHAAQIVAAARAGKDILSEKPLALTTRELDTIERAVKNSGRRLMVGHQLRFHPVVDWVVRNAARLGPRYHLDLEWCLRIAGHEGRCWEDYRSGGFFMELGVHLTDLSRHLLGDVRRVSGHTLRLNPRRVTEDFTHCLVQHRSRATSSLIVSANHRTTRQGRLIGRMLGAKGRIDFTIYPYGRPFNTATLTLDGGKSVFVPDVKTIAMPRRFPRSQFKEFPGFFDVYQKQTHAFLDAVRRRKTPPVTAADGRAAVEMVLATYASEGGKAGRASGCHPLLQR